MTHKKRFLISTIRTFLAGFIGVFIMFLSTLNSWEDVTIQLVIATVFSGLVAGVNLILKALQEKLQGKI